MVNYVYFMILELQQRVPLFAMMLFGVHPAVRILSAGNFLNCLKNESEQGTMLHFFVRAGLV